MYHQARLYDLSFVSSARESHTSPQILFTLERKHLAECIRRLEWLVESSDVEKYCGKVVDFCMPVSDLFGRIEFGYGRCGVMQERGDEVSFCIELCETHLNNATATINLLTHVLLADFAPEPTSSNHAQQVDLETCCAHTPHGHSVGGYISGQMREWLRKQWHKNPKGRMNFASIPKEVVTAMRQTWSAVAPQNQKKWAKDCNGAITEDGRFILNCFGDACDLAIYPDNMCVDEYSSVRFSCHNLDGARQQLTLLAGLAKLCELARTET